VNESLTASLHLASPRLTSARLALPRFLPGNSYKHLDDARVEKGHVTASAVTSLVSSDVTIKAFSRMSDPGFIRLRSRSFSLKYETVKYGHESQGNRTRERLHWRGPAAYIKDRPILSSERAPQKQDGNCQTIINNWS
jgi:hypothetical protein